MQCTLIARRQQRQRRQQNADEKTLSHKFYPIIIIICCILHSSILPLPFNNISGSVCEQSKVWCTDQNRYISLSSMFIYANVFIAICGRCLLHPQRTSTPSQQQQSLSPQRIHFHLLLPSILFTTRKKILNLRNIIIISAHNFVVAKDDFQFSFVVSFLLHCADACLSESNFNFEITLWKMKSKIWKWFWWFCVSISSRWMQAFYASVALFYGR